LLAHSGLDDSDLVYASFRNRYHQMPYCIVVDHRWKSVVLSIRGTLSLEDCVIDVLIDPSPLDDLGREHNFNGEGQYCHDGVLGCAKQIYKDLERHKILESLLLSQDALYPNYTLRITGHSLGAGTATLLGYFMRKTYPDLRVIAISPPGGFITWRLATECKGFVTSFVLDSDLVPRLSVNGLERLRDEVLDLIGRIKVPKAVIASTFLKNGVFFCCNDADHDLTGGEIDDYDGREDQDDTDDGLDFLTDDNAKMLHSSSEASSLDTTFSRQLRHTKELQAARRRVRGTTRNIQLFPPGKMVHLVKTGERNTCGHSLQKCVTCCTTNAGYEYTPVWVGNADFDEVVVSPTMGTDHFPNRICVELERVAMAFGIDVGEGVGLDLSPGERDVAEEGRRMEEEVDLGRESVGMV